MAESRRVVYGAIAANLAIAVTKFAVAGMTGSSAMLSEGVHSAVDAGNGGLLLVGLKLAQRPASDQHPFGHGKEVYFWSLIVAVLVFALGGGVSMYEGVQHLREPAEVGDPFWNYVVLAAAGVFEGASFALAWRQFQRQRPPGPVWRALRNSKDPATYTVLAEDGAALLGLAIAAAGIAASRATGQPAFDGAASIAIGLLLCGVAVLLIRESRGLLVGEGVGPATLAQVRELARAEPGVRDVGPVLSMYIGPEEVLMTLEVDVDADAPAASIATLSERLERRIAARFPRIRRLYVVLRHAVPAR